MRDDMIFAGRLTAAIMAVGLVVIGLLSPAGATTIRLRSDLHVVQAAAPGTPHCVATTGSENAAAAQATSRTRAGAGLGPVRPHARLAQVAAMHACDMARRGLMAHEGSTTRGPSQRVKASGYRPMVTAENIAAGPLGLEQVLSAWNLSAGHRSNILIPQLADYGIGRAVSADGKTVFWAAVYAAPRGR